MRLILFNLEDLPETRGTWIVYIRKLRIMLRGEEAITETCSEHRRLYRLLLHSGSLQYGCSLLQGEAASIALRLKHWPSPT